MWIEVNTYSPQSVKSPGKDYGINERIEVCKDRLISGFDRWKLTESNGLQIINIIHNIKEKSRRTNEDVYPSDLETYCTKLKVVRTVCEDVINSLSEFHKEMKSSICIIDSMNDNDELKERLKVIETFLSKLKQLYEINLEMKILVIGQLLMPCELMRIMCESFFLSFYRKHHSCNHLQWFSIPHILVELQHESIWNL